MEQQPIHQTTRELIDGARARQEALSRVDEVMAQATGTAHDLDNTMELTVDARGKLLRLTLTPDAARWGPDRLGSLIVEVAQVAMQEATQDGYNKVALLLGENMTSLIEQISGVPAPARAEHDDNGLTAEEFQRRRAERLAAQGGGAGVVAAGAVAPESAATPEAAAGPDDDFDVHSFDPATLRSDR
ncbi:YbaB/EbfC family nucleoid-associated protein [Saccharomonospora sp. CUA-673]|uniref:YbaB/EbfC family nucleoid-associated protein n=1 Tax=Saccharomonospora sp. CUA-673 TaxID=1904969 RepID=UPI00096A5768|nr:YbaB/EbfC family nucleoid-associated protein [Saccharomonospora sp. CUA-673]